jgi:hypothetical protein
MINVSKLIYCTYADHDEQIILLFLFYKRESKIINSKINDVR